MPVRGKNFEVFAQIFLDGAGLGRRFNDYEIACHTLMSFEFARGADDAAPHPASVPRLMQIAIQIVHHQIFHPHKCLFLTGLVEQNHKDDPLDLAYIEFVVFQG